MSGENLIISDEAWGSLFNRPIEEIINAPLADLQAIEHRMLFQRLTMVVGWTPDLGKLAISKIM